MNKDIYKVFGEMPADVLLEIIAASMDDYLYAFDL